MTPTKTEELMKKLIALVAALVSLSSFAAPSPQDSWETIRAEVAASPFLKIESGYAVFVGRPIVAFDVCIDGDNFKTVRQFPIYERQWLPGGGDNDRYRDVIVGYEYLTYPISYERTYERCYGRNDNRCETVVEQVNQETVKNISVAKLVGRGGRDRDDRWKTLFIKEYAIPACE